MVRRAALVGALAFLAGSPFAARSQATPIRSGETLSGSLDTTDPALPDGSHYDTFVYQGAPGERVIITLRSADFDAYLFGGLMSEGSFSATDEDDDSGGGTDSRLTVTVGADGSYVIPATTYEGGENGAYTLTLLPGDLSAEPVEPLPIVLGEPVQGRLDVSDPLLDDGSHYDLYIYRGVSNEQIVVTLRSAEFDTYLYGGRIDGVSFVDQDSDDDSAGGTDSRLVVRAGPDGTYVIRANSLEPGRTGSYTLTIDRP
jgi:hypothetical protein